MHYKPMVGNGSGPVLTRCLWWSFITAVAIASAVRKFFVIALTAFDRKWLPECEELRFLVSRKMYKDGVIIFGGIHEGGVASLNSCVRSARVRLQLSTRFPMTPIILTLFDNWPAKEDQRHSDQEHHARHSCHDDDQSVRVMAAHHRIRPHVSAYGLYGSNRTWRRCLHKQLPSPWNCEDLTIRLRNSAVNKVTVLNLEIE